MPGQGRGSLGTDSRAQAPGSIPQLGGVAGTQMARRGLRAASPRGVLLGECSDRDAGGCSGLSHRRAARSVEKEEGSLSAQGLSFL